MGEHHTKICIYEIKDFVHKIEIFIQKYICRSANLPKGVRLVQTEKRPKVNHRPTASENGENGDIKFIDVPKASYKSFREKVKNAPEVNRNYNLFDPSDVVGSDPLKAKGTRSLTSMTSHSAQTSRQLSSASNSARQNTPKETNSARQSRGPGDTYSARQSRTLPENNSARQTKNMTENNNLKQTENISNHSPSKTNPSRPNSKHSRPNSGVSKPQSGKSERSPHMETSKPSSSTGARSKLGSGRRLSSGRKSSAVVEQTPNSETEGVEPIEKEYKTIDPQEIVRYFEYSLSFKAYFKSEGNIF